MENIEKQNNQFIQNNLFNTSIAAKIDSDADKKSRDILKNLKKIDYSKSRNILFDKKEVTFEAQNNKDIKDKLKNDNKVINSSIKESESSLRDGLNVIKNDSDINLSLIKSNGFSFDDAASKLKEGLDNENYLKRGLNRFQKNDFKRAINDFTRGLRNNPENIDIYLVRANAKMKLEQFNKAIEDFNLYLLGNSKNLNPFLDRGDCYLKLGSRELALKDYNKASSLGSEIGLIKKKKS